MEGEKFWKGICFGESSLSVFFPLLFAIGTSKGAWVTDLWEEFGEGQHWRSCFLR